MKNTLRIATRNSSLALWQANFVKEKILHHHPFLSIELIPMTTQGDRILDTDLSKMGGKGLFIKELEEALLHNKADIAVHSMKDVTQDFPPGLAIMAVCEREDPRDAFVSLHYEKLSDLPAGARIGTSSLRRKSQLLARHPHCLSESLRGNVETRLKRLEEGKFDGILLATAGLKRLGLHHRIREILPIETFLPAVGQGALGIECHQNNKTITDIIACLNHSPTEICVRAERSMNAVLQGNCSVPIAGLAQLTGEQLTLRGLVANPEGTLLLKAEKTGNLREAEKIGQAVAEDLLTQGALKILKGYI